MGTKEPKLYALFLWDAENMRWVLNKHDLVYSELPSRETVFGSQFCWRRQKKAHRKATAQICRHCRKMLRRL
jgi:hypothetical protein